MDKVRLPRSSETTGWKSASGLGFTGDRRGREVTHHPHHRVSAARARTPIQPRASAQLHPLRGAKRWIRYSFALTEIAVNTALKQWWQRSLDLADAVYFDSLPVPLVA